MRTLRPVLGAILYSVLACTADDAPPAGGSSPSGSGASGEEGEGEGTAGEGSAGEAGSSDPGGEEGSDTEPAETTGTPGEGPTFAEDIAPIFAARCWSCHVPGGVAPFSLLDYDEVAPMAPLIVATLESRTMPPWPPDSSGACGDFVDARWLSDEEIATVSAWLDADTPSGDLTLVPDPPGPASLGDVSATMAVGPYTPQGSPPENPLDDYRCFVVPSPSPVDTVLTAFEVHPGVVEEAHHIVIFSLANDQAVEQAVAMSGADGRPGYECFGAAGVESEIVGAWTPGVQIVRFPEGTGARVPGGRPMVVQMHYNLTAGAIEDTTSLDLQFDPAATALRSYVLSDYDLSIPPGMDDHVEGIAETLSSEPLSIVAAFPHMHQIGARMRVGSLDGTCVIDVPRYDFNWQELYRYQQPIVVPGGATVGIECHYDSTTRKQTTTFGEGSSDEMCGIQLMALP